MQRLCHFTSPSAAHEGSNCSIFSATWYFPAIPVGVKWDLMVLICVFLKASDDVEYFFHVLVGRLYTFFRDMSVQILYF